MNCYFCENAAVANSQLIFESTHWRVVLHEEQAYLGRSTVVAKCHRTALAELSEEEWQDFRHVVRKLEAAVKAGLGATLCNWSCLMNSAYLITPPIPHVHWHFRPRYDHAVEMFGYRFIDPEFGHHYDRDRTAKVSEGLRAEIVMRIKGSMDSR
jgi:diadenosine tetraphosphate (Ap4A) HIT family hydrolase